MKRRLEVSVALLVGGGGSIAFYKVPTLASLSDYRALGSLVASVAATLLGFLIAALALLASVSQHWFIRNLQRTPHFSGILKDLYISSSRYLAALIAAFGMMLAPAPPGTSDVVHGSALHVATCVALGLIVVATLTLIPVGKKFWLILINLRPNGTRFEAMPADDA